MIFLISLMSGAICCFLFDALLGFPLPGGGSLPEMDSLQGLAYAFGVALSGANCLAGLLGVLVDTGVGV